MIYFTIFVAYVYHFRDKIWLTKRIISMLQID